MIIDTHVHFGCKDGFDELKEEDVLYSMREYGIDYAIVSSIEAVEFDHELNLLPPAAQTPQLVCLQKTLRFAKSAPEKLAAAFWVKPYTETVTAEVAQCVADNLDIIKAIKVHPYHSKTAFDGEKMVPYIELAERFSLPIIIHTGGCDEASPVRVYRAALKHPNVNFIMAHMGLGTDNTEAIDLICSLPNLYGDTAWVPVESTVKLIQKSSSQKVVFGSDNPIDGKDTYLHNKWGDRSLYQSYFHELKELISADDYENLMWRTASELFNLNLK